MIDAFALSNHYSVEPLKCKLEAILALHITEENVCSLLLLADAYQANRVRINKLSFLISMLCLFLTGTVSSQSAKTRML